MFFHKHETSFWTTLSTNSLLEWLLPMNLLLQSALGLVISGVYLKPTLPDDNKADLGTGIHLTSHATSEFS